MTAVRTHTADPDPGRVPREPVDAAPELLTFLDAAHRRIEELELELAALRRERRELPGRAGRRLGRLS